ncbi:hypothetical protein LX16_4613 [Stackebrandtia albiflava]|uniref:Uncharacterized protein n=1 Tax=Stackebrandtia albiflava TaxID=406432 RepID=A0A562UQD2_9ACTN|nr:hypothetical protein [Stackebrandtia albiflava]TWJ07833.1 hypothetical protein LX16_4613 [Stackebrandtia albiflava]
MSNSDDIMTKAVEIQELFMKIAESDFMVECAYAAPAGDKFSRLIEPYADVIERFRWAAELDPGKYDPMLEHIEYTKATLDSAEISDAMARIRTRLTYWEGNTAKDFVDNFLTPFDGVRIRQVFLAENVRRAVQATRDIEETVQRDMLELQDGIIEVLKQIKKEEKGFFDKLMAVAKVVGTIAGAAVAFGSMGPGLAIGLGLIATTGEAMSLQETFSVTVEGENPAEVVESMDKAINGLRDAMTREEDKLIEILAEDITMIDRDRVEPVPDFVCRRPDVADGVADLEQFRPPPSTR